MLTITTTAKEKLQEIFKKNTNPEVSIRIIASSSKPNMFDLVYDKKKEGDQVVKNEEGIDVLIIEPDVAHSLEGKIIDYRVTTQGAGFTIS